MNQADYEQAKKRLEKTPNAQNALDVMIGAYYQERSEGTRYLNLAQKLAGPGDFQPYNTMMINAQYFIEALPGRRHKLTLHSNRVGDYVDERWRALNPFIVPSSPPSPPSSNEGENKVYVGIRMTNFDKEGTHYFAAHGGKIKNYYEGQLLSLPPSSLPSSPEKEEEGVKEERIYTFQDHTSYPKFHPSNHVEGLEDYRVAAFHRDSKTRYVAIVVSVDAHKEEPKTPRQSLVDLHFNVIEGKGYLELTNLRPLRGICVNPSECQKNWLPFFTEEGELRAIYKSDPLTIIRINENTGNCSLVCSKKIKGLAHFRGSAPPVPWKGKYLYAVHVVGFLPEGKGRVYYHRLVELEKDFKSVRVSRMFYLNRKHTVEYISGGYNDGTQVHFTFGADDKDAWIASLSHVEIEGLFEGN